MSIPESHLPLADIAPHLDPPITVKRLATLGSPGRRSTNGFPDPVRVQGRFVFYDLGAVQEWWAYHSRAIARLHAKQHLNFGSARHDH